jgi:hypothetical protein
VLLAVREGAQAKGALVDLVGGSRAAVYRHVQVVTRLGLVESRIVGVGRGVHHVVELTAAGRIVLAGLRLSGSSPGNPRTGERVGGDVEVPLGRREAEELLGDAWGFVRWRFLRGQVDEDVYWQRRAWLKQVARRVGVELEGDEGLKSRGERRRG